MFKKRFILSLSVFSFTLSTFSYRMAILAYCALLVVSVHAFIGEKNKNVLPLDFLLLILGCVAYVLLSSSLNYFHVPYFIKFLGMLFYVILLYWLFRSGHIRIKDLIFSCKALIVIHASFFILQLSLYLVTGDVFDFDAYIREQESRLIYHSQALEGFYLDIRGTGLFSEPSFYSYTVYPIALLLGLYEKKFNIFAAIGIITSLMSFSVAAFIVVMAGTILSLLVFKGYNKSKFMIIAIFVIMSPAMYSIFQSRVLDSVDYNAVESRSKVFYEFQERGYLRNLFGSGSLWDEDMEIGVTGLNGANTRDASFFINLFFTSGAIGTLLFLGALLLLFSKKKKYYFATLVVMLFKIYLLSSMFWLFLVMALCLKSNEEALERTC